MSRRRWFSAYDPHLPSNISAFAELLPTLNSGMPKIIGEAVQHSELVCRREHLKVVERHHRVGIFVTSLRNCLQYGIASLCLPESKRLGRFLVTYLCPPKVWTDIGIVSEHTIGHGLDELLPVWLNAMPFLEDRTQVRHKMERSLQELEGSLAVMQSFTNEAQKLNGQANIVSSSLCNILEGIE